MIAVMPGSSRKHRGRVRSTKRTPTASSAKVNQLVRMVAEQASMLEKLREEQNIQFRRMAQLQAELDSLKQLLDKGRTAP